MQKMRGFLSNMLFVSLYKKLFRVKYGLNRYHKSFLLKLYILYLTVVQEGTTTPNES